MQVFILGAGLGTRLAPLSHILPKPLMPIFQKPLIYHTMDHYIKSGATEFIVNISCLDWMWEKAFPENEYRGVPVRLSRESCDAPLDSGGGLKKIMPWVKSDAPLLVHNGDILTDIPAVDLLEAHRRGGHMVTMALRRVEGKRNVGFDVRSGLVTDMRHALGRDPGEYQFAGVYVMDPRVAELFPSDDVFSIVPTWLELIRRKQVGGVVFDWANWHEIGSPEAYLHAVTELNSACRIHPSAEIAPGAYVSEDCVVGQDACIPADCELDDCIVWPRTHVAPGHYRRCILTPRITVRLEKEET